MARPSSLALVAGFLVGSLATGGALWAQSRPTTSATTSASPSPVVDGGQPFEIVDTPGSTYVLNKATGQVWRLSFTDVGGNKYWYGMYAPMEPATSFEEFRARIRRELAEQR
jgi:hypothetical protein